MFPNAKQKVNKTEEKKSLKESQIGEILMPSKLPRQKNHV